MRQIVILVLNINVMHHGLFKPVNFYFILVWGI